MLHHLQSQESVYNIHPSQNGMYTSSGHNTQAHPSSDYLLDTDSQKQQASKMNNVPPTSFRSFNAYPNNNRQRHHTSTILTSPNSYRESSHYFTPPSDLYSSQLTSPTQSHLPAFDSRASYDFGGGAQPPLNGAHKSAYSVSEHQYSGSQNILQPHKLAQPAQPTQINGYNGGFVNGLHLSSQTPYGPHIPAGANGAGPAATTSALMPGNGMLVNGPSAGSAPQQQEDISTIFVVGFPDDMQEREFQNMFTFSPGFEAATLKIPNKEYTSYGGNLAPSGTTGLRSAAPGTSYAQGFNGSNDPYNLVTVNQGGVVVDGGRDGMSSWPAPSLDDGTGQYLSGGSAGLNMPPRKQIIGFAKFRSREEAVQARDQLQGRRVDIEKGGLTSANSGAPLGQGLAGVGSSSSLASLQQLNNVASHDMYAMEPRDRDYTGMRMPYQLSDIPNVQNGLPRDPRDEEERKREREVAALTAMGLGTGHRGPREREEDDRERRRQEKEMARLRPGNTMAYDAFYSVPQGISRQASNTAGSAFSNPMLLSGEDANSSYLPSIPNLHSQQHDNVSVGPWDAVGRNSARPIAGSSQRSTSPTDPSSLGFEGSRPLSPAQERPSYSDRAPGDSQSSSSSGSQSGRSSGNVVSDEEMARAVNGLAVSTHRGNTSPQLPSPASGASSGGSTRNGVDQNPPINTLYVGNLPIAPMPLGYPPDTLEDSLRELFSAQPGYKRLSFKQKNTGPMCFVEFEDVNYAAKAMNELYGNNLNGLVKAGGIRLSYSKNPLGVRTPTSATASGPALQHQQSQPSFQSISASYPAHNDERAVFVNREGAVVSPPPASHNFLASPPPRFFSTSPSAIPFGGSSGTNTNVSRGSPYGYTLAPSNPIHTSSFSPFGVSNSVHSSIPDHTQPEQQHEQHSHYIPRALSPGVHNIEPTRAG
ncbi:hypothetical protein BDZ89DRAFT_1129768 [Hymenopellis radicata]|nr:hypothetical protein BDZ89DRAFT_1129768 [Hymenopellis radicata]